MAEKFLSFKDNTGPLSADLTAAAEHLRGSAYGPAAAAFKEIRDILRTGVKENLNGAFTPLSQVTLDYKARMGRAQRGQNEWYIFLHDRGKGYSYWSVDGKRKANKTGARRDKRERNRPGTTQFPERRSFYINAAAETASVARYNTLLQTICDEVKG